MKKISTMALACLISAAGFAQLTTPPGGGNQKSKTIQWIGGLVEVEIEYNSPDVHAPNGDDRKGHIWGELVPYGLTNLGFGPSTAAPWRAGANENTTIWFSHDVQIGGKALKAGKYGVHIIVEKDNPWTFIFSNNSTNWGSFFYDDKEDALRVQSTPVDAEYTEYLTYGFEDRKATSTTAYIQWENKKAAFTIEIPNADELYVAKFRNDLKSSLGFNFQNYVQAANFCATNKINLDEALTWSEAAIAGQFFSQENFTTLQTKANVLNAMKKEAEAGAIMTKAVNHPTASVGQIHGYGRTLVGAGKNAEALEVFKLNAKLHPEDKFTPNVGLARGYAAAGDNKNSAKYWTAAIKNLPENQKQFLSVYEGELKKVQGGK